MDWLVVLIKFNVRPKYYIYNKNDQFSRQIDLPVLEVKTKAAKKVKAEKENKVKIPNFDIKDLIQLDDLIENQNVSVRLRAGKKGGLNVAFEQVKR